MNASEPQFFARFDRNRTRAASVFVTALMAISLAACSGAETSSDDRTPVPASSDDPTVESPSPSPSPSPELSLEDFGIDSEQNSRIGIAATGPEFTDSYGTYRRAEIQDGSMLLVPTTAAYGDDALDAWGEDQVAAGEEFTKRFIVSYVFDNQSIYDFHDETAAAFLDEVAPFITEEWRDDWYDYDPHNIAGVSGGRSDAAVALYLHHEDATFPQYLDGPARYTLRSMRLTSAYNDSNNQSDIIYTYDLEVLRPANVRTLDGDDYVPGSVNSTFEQWVAIRPKADGGFEISGWWSDSLATPFDANGEQLPLWSERDDSEEEPAP